MGVRSGPNGPVELLAAAIHAVTSQGWPHEIEDGPPEQLTFRTGAELLGWASSTHPALLVHLTNQQLVTVAAILDGMLREHAYPDRSLRDPGYRPM